MRQHVNEKHPQEDPNTLPQSLFKMKIHRRYTTAMERQLGEALNLARSGGAGAEGVMNRKDEYSRCVVPEMVMTEGWRDQTKQKRSRENQNQTIKPAKKPRLTTQQQQQQSQEQQLDLQKKEAAVSEIRPSQ